MTILKSVFPVLYSSVSCCMPSKHLTWFLHWMCNVSESRHITFPSKWVFFPHFCSYLVCKFRSIFDFSSHLSTHFQKVTEFYWFEYIILSVLIIVNSSGSRADSHIISQHLLIFFSPYYIPLGDVLKISYKVIVRIKSSNNYILNINPEVFKIYLFSCV